jgi:6-phosphogluconolactonase
MAGSPQIVVARDAEALAQRAAQWIVNLTAASPGRFAIALSGGSTPRRLYQLLAAEPYRGRLPWARVHWFWGDERFVPWDHPESNYGMARNALLAHAPIPPENIHGIEFAGEPAEAARRYQDMLQSYYGAARLDPARPLFDVQLLGLGPDGHTASLFPGTETLDEHEHWVASIVGARPEPRITLTYPAIDSSRHVAFLAAGADKREMLARVLGGDWALPAARVRAQSDLTWFVDAAAHSTR